MAILRNVAKTDTLETQRQKINLIASDVYGIGSGGSDLSTGNLKLGDGTKNTPSLAFVSDTELGFYKPSSKTIGIVSSRQKIVDFSTTSADYYRSIILKRNFLTTLGTSVTNYGTGYDGGTYQNISLIGGSGQNATGDFTVTSYLGSVTNAGSGYIVGSYTGVKLNGGNGSGAVASFVSEGIQGSITTPGSGYVSNAYPGVLLTNGSGSGATANIVVTNGAVTNVTILTSGSGYLNGDVLSASNTDLGGTGSGFQYTISNNPRKITNFTLTSYGTGYQTSNVLTIPGSLTGVTTTLGGTVSGVSTTLSTSSTNITVASNAGITAGMLVSNAQGDTGTLAAGTTVLSVSGSTIVTLSTNPTISGAATLTFSSANPTTISVTSQQAAAIQLNSIVSKTAGTGVLAANTTVSQVDTTTNTVTLSQTPTTPGSATLTFTPPYGSGSGFAYTLSSLGVISNFSINEGGLGYVAGDTFTVSASELTSAITYTVTYTSVSRVTFTTTVSSSVFTGGDSLEVANTGGILNASVFSGTGTLSTQTFTNVQQSSTSGSGSGARFTIDKTSAGIYTLTAITATGSGYGNADTITINGASLGGTTPANNLVISVSNIVTAGTATVLQKSVSGGNISYADITVDSGNIISGSLLRKVGTTTPTFSVNTISSRVKYKIDTGSGATFYPSLTLYKDQKYIFNISAAGAHPFYFSIHPDGNNNKVSGITTTLSTSSSNITVSSTTGILLGMEVTVTSGSGALVGPGSTTIVTVTGINGNIITLSSNPYSSGSATLQFAGAVYTGSEISRTASALNIVPTTTTPTLYYFCNAGVGHEDEAGLDGQEATITINQINPKTFGSGFSAVALEISSSDIIKSDVETGTVYSTSFEGSDCTLGSGNIQNLTSSSITTTNLSATNINSTGLTVTCTGNINISASNILYGTTGSLNPTTGDFTTSGIIKSTGSFNINDKLSITNNTISSTSGNNIVLSPFAGRVAKISSTSALTIPSGTTAERPSSLAENGSIRYNSDTGQYEGYSATTSSWSSLGGVRDLDGNTYIAAEASIGANDNTLYFYNDGNNTIKVTPSEFQFNNLKSITSLSVSVPQNIAWTPNTPVTNGTYLNYGFNLYEVTAYGTTSGSNSPPTHTSGSVVNGTATLTWYSSYVDQVTFGKVSQVNIGTTTLPTTLVINGGLKLFGDTVSTITNDLVLQPYSGKKVFVNATSSLVIPAGDTSQRGIAAQGSIRYSTTLTSFEGYNGTNWTSLGGVKDVDGNTYIIPETTPGANENILYFYNNGSNTLRVTTSALEFRSIDAITSTNNNLDLDVETVSFNNLAFTLDNTGSTSTKLLSTRTNLDFALSSGVTSDPLIRLNTTGDILINKSYSTGSNTFVKVLDNELKTFELDDVKVETSDLTLTRGATEFGLVTIFNPSLHSGAKVVLIADNVTTNDREVIEYNVVSKNGDIYHTEYGNVTTGLDIVSTAFDFDGSGNVRLTPTLVSSLLSGNVVNITVIKTIFKK